MENTSIYAAGKAFDIGCRVIKWDEPNGYSFYKTGKLHKRNLTFEQLQDQIKMFVVHHSATYTASQTYNGLVGRGLSVNLILNDDCDENGYATLYQCADIMDACYSQGEWNNFSTGIEVSYEPDVHANPNYYSTDNQKKFNVPNHNIVEDTFHGYKRKVFAPTQAQLNTCAALIYGYTQLFPNVKPTFPRDDQGKVIKTVIPNLDTYQGLVLHGHLTTEKWDAAGFNCDWVEEDIATRIKLGF